MNLRERWIRVMRALHHRRVAGRRPYDFREIRTSDSITKDWYAPGFAGIHKNKESWIPACAGMTVRLSHRDRQALSLPFRALLNRPFEGLTGICPRICRRSLDSFSEFGAFLDHLNRYARRDFGEFDH